MKNGQIAVKRNVLTFFLFIWIISFPDFGKAQLLPIRTFNVQDGLPQSQVTTILQDTLGYLWIGTADGLARFDGIYFENFNSHNGLAGNAVTAAYEDGDSLIWFGLDRSGVSIYEIHTKKFRNFKLNQALHGFRITSILRDANGTIWIGTDQHGLFRYDGTSANFLDTKNGIPDVHISYLKIGPDSNLWVATWNGIVVLTLKTMIKRDLSIIFLLKTVFRPIKSKTFFFVNQILFGSVPRVKA